MSVANSFASQATAVLLALEMLASGVPMDDPNALEGHIGSVVIGSREDEIMHGTALLDSVLFGIDQLLSRRPE